MKNIIEQIEVLRDRTTVEMDKLAGIDYGDEPADHASPEAEAIYHEFDRIKDQVEALEDELTKVKIAYDSVEHELVKQRGY